LFEAGLSAAEIVPIVKISKAVVYTIRQAHQACIKRDWSTLQKMSVSNRATVDWAMKVTGADKVFLETFPKEDVEPEAPAPVVPEPVITIDDFLAMYAVMQDVRSLLTEIRDTLK
jgi:hypothetical protein